MFKIKIKEKKQGGKYLNKIFYNDIRTHWKIVRFEVTDNGQTVYYRSEVSDFNTEFKGASYLESEIDKFVQEKSWKLKN